MFVSKNFFLAGAPGFTPGNQTFTTSGTFTIPTGTTNLQIEMWGGGGSGGSGQLTGAYPQGSNNTSGSASSCNGLTANGGTKANQTPGGAGGSASGGTTNTTGGSGTSPNTGVNCSSDKSTFYVAGTGGNSPNGGTQTAPTCGTSSQAGPAPGAGGNGATGYAVSGFSSPSGGGGGAGGYSTKTFTGLSGSLAYTVGTAGQPGFLIPGPGGKSGIAGYGALNGGAGGSGAIKFTWS